MRRITRNVVLALVAVMVLLLALGALPGLLQTGDPYRVTAAEVSPGNATADPAAALNGSALSERQYPYTTTALEEGESGAYWKGYVGFKEAFTHSPFDELSALEARNASARTDEGVLVRYNGTLFDVSVGKA